MSLNKKVITFEKLRVNAMGTFPLGKLSFHRKFILIESAYQIACKNISSELRNLSIEKLYVRLRNLNVFSNL